MIANTRPAVTISMHGGPCRPPPVVYPLSAIWRGASAPDDLEAASVSLVALGNNPDIPNGRYVQSQQLWYSRRRCFHSQQSRELPARVVKREMVLN